MRTRVQVLGTVSVTVGDGCTAIASRSQRIVLSVLAARNHSVVPVDLLVDALWPDGPPRTAVSSLRTYVSRLRRLLGDALSGVPGGYRLSIGEADLDLSHFEELLDEAAAAPAALAVDLLDEALRVWHGPPFGDVGDIEAVRSVTARLEERWLGAREQRARSLLACGRAQDAVAVAEELLEDHPLRERVWVALVGALTASARPTEALRAYQRAVDTLGEAGLEPTAELRRAEAAALAGVPDAPVRRAVPLPASSFVGREADREALARHTAASSIVTLVGPGGVGKTRLARTVAADIEHRFSAGARMVELAGVDDPTRVAAVVADELGLVVGSDGPLAALASASHLDVLVLIDNCEHVIDAAAAVVVGLTSGGGPLRVVTTSREPLAVDGEQLWPVQPLPVDGPSGAVQLFVERVRSAHPDFTPGPEEHELVTEIVRRLDGLPLAIEMAAAATATMPLGMLRDRLDAELELPALKRRDLDERHRTLKALLDWSLRLLDDEAQSMFCALSVFAGQVTARDVSQVSDHPSPFDVLCTLADHSLVQVDTTADEPHFVMLHTVRQRAREAAGPDTPGLRARHAAWLVDAVSAADQGLRTPDERRAHDRLERLLDDARAAMAWALAHDLALAVRLAGRLFLYGQTRLRDEPLAWAAEVVDRAGPLLTGSDGELALAAAAHRAVNRGDLAAARALIERAVALNESTADSLVFEIQSDIDLFSGNIAPAVAAAHAGLRSASGADDPHGMVVNLTNAVLASAYAGDQRTASQALQEFSEPSELAPSDRAWLRYIEGERLLDLDPEPALVALHEAATIADGVGNRYLASVARVSYASLLSRTGDAMAARQPFAELIAHWRSHGDRTHLLVTLRNLVPVLDRLHMHERGAELLGTVLDDTVSPTFGAERAMLEGALGQLERTLGPGELERRLEVGRGRPLEEAARLAQQWLDVPADPGDPRW